MKKLIVLLILGLLIGGLGTAFYFTNYFVPNAVDARENLVREELTGNEELISVAFSLKEIDKYTIVDDEFIDQYIVYKEVPSAYVTNETVTSNNVILNNVTLVNIKPGTMLYNQYFMDNEEWFDNSKREVELNVDNIVADQVQPGNLIDVILNYQDGTYDVLLSKIKVNRVISPYIIRQVNDMGVVEYVTIENPAQRNSDRDFIITFNANEEEFRNLTLGKKLGVLETRRYIDESQEPSIVTFDYAQGLRRTLSDQGFNTSYFINEKISEETAVQETTETTEDEVDNN